MKRGVPGVHQLCNLIRCGMTAPPAVHASHSVTEFHPDALHTEIKLCEVAYQIAEKMAKEHPDPEKASRYKPKHAWRDEIKSQCGVHRNKTGLDGHMAHKFLRTRNDWLQHLEGHRHHGHFAAYINAISVMLDEMWSNTPDMRRYASAAATAHCIRGGLLIQYVAIGVYEHVAFDHIHALLSVTMARYANVYVEGGNILWKDHLTSGGNWGAGKGLKADEDELREAASMARQRRYQQAAITAEEAAAAIEDAVKKGLAIEQAVHNCTLLKRKTKTAMTRYMTITEPRIAKHMRTVKQCGHRVTASRLERLQPYKLPMVPLPDEL
jgi:hypothetical protein